MTYLDTGLWADVRELPGALGDTLEAADGIAEAAELLRGAARIVATGNGAAYYVAHALWLASLESGNAVPPAAPIVAVPCGVAVRERFRWQPGDAVLAVSSSGEFRDVVEVAQRAYGRRPCVAITASAESSLAAAASATVLQRVASQRAVTHTQALAGAYAAGLALWAAVTGDAGLAALVARAPDAAAGAVAAAEEWAADKLGTFAAAARADGDEAAARAAGHASLPAAADGSETAASARDHASLPAAAVVAGGGVAWAAALELALMLKEIARIPAEGVETREGATSAMFGLNRGHLMVSLDPAGDPLGDEALRLCAAAGATTLRLPSADADTRLAPVTTLPAAAALAAELALAAGHDVDRPTWTDAYYETARSAT